LEARVRIELVNVVLGCVGEDRHAANRTVVRRNSHPLRDHICIPNQHRLFCYVAQGTAN
jgi:hypothetical protein